MKISETPTPEIARMLRATQNAPNPDPYVVEVLEAELGRRFNVTELFEQAKQCKTAHGGGLLLSVKRWLESRETVYEGNQTLSELFDEIIARGESAASELQRHKEKAGHV